jgi:hypothetical protein
LVAWIVYAWFDSFRRAPHQAPDKKYYKRQAFHSVLITGTRHGVAAKQIERQTGVTYKCAWRICHQLRKRMASADAQRGSIGGKGKHVEVDETLVGASCATMAKASTVLTRPRHSESSNAKDASLPDPFPTKPSTR